MNIFLFHIAALAIQQSMEAWWDKIMMWYENNAYLSTWFDPDQLPSTSVIIWIATLIVILRFLHIFSSPQRPAVTMHEKPSEDGIHRLIGGMSILSEVYRPPPIWGRSGHVQTAAYGLLGHALLRRTANRRVELSIPDGTTLTFDIFEPTNKHESGQDLTLTLTPGIANSSESNYIRTLVHYAQERGYRCAVLNHLGALADVKLTGTRIFSYGGTEEITAMMLYLFNEYPSSKFVSVGFSMGGNITTQFLLKRLPEKDRHRILVGLSVCQGYSATVSAPMYHDWENGRRAYNYIITENMKRLLRRNYDQAVAPHVKSGLVDEQRLWNSTSIVSFDEQYNRKVAGFDSVDAFYAWCDCLPHLDKLKVPMVFFNAEDDPIVPPVLWQPVKEMAKKNDNMAFVLTKHGGHLGFLEGGSFSPKSVTWLDRFIVELADQAVVVYGN